MSSEELFITKVITVGLRNFEELYIYLSSKSKREDYIWGRSKWDVKAVNEG